MENNRINFLLTSVGRRGYLVKYFKDALNGRGCVHVANSSGISPAFQYADRTVVTPLIYDETYIPFLLDYCTKNDISVIISLFDIDLPVLAKNRKKFEEIGVRVIVSDYNIVKICNDKWLTYKFLTENGIKVPKTYVEIDKVKKDLENGTLKFPLIIKPRWGMGSIGIFKADNMNELDVLYQKTLNEIKKSYLKYESASSIDNSVLIQENLTGNEYGLDVINDLESNYINTVVKRKYAMRSGETDCAVTEDNSIMKELGKKLSSCTKHIANLDVDVFLVNSNVYVLEMNARFGGGYPFSHMAGVNLPKALVEWSLGNVVDKVLLEENIGVFSHKDINLVYIPNVHIEEEKDYDTMCGLMNIFQSELFPSLSERNVDIDTYVKKIYNYGHMYVAKNTDDKIAGMIAVYLNDTKLCQGYVSFLAVKSDFRSQGIGRALMNHIEKEALIKKLNAIKLEVRTSNISGINFYSKNNYKICEYNEAEQSYHMIKSIRGK